MLHHSFLALAAAIATLLTWPTDACAQWKWRDKNGQVHISDLPPPKEIADKDVLQRPPAPAKPAAPASAPVRAASAPAAAAPTIDPELEARRRAAEQEQQAKAKQDEERATAQRAGNCERARTQMRTLESGIRLARVNEKGEREILDDNARAEETRRAKAAIAANCR